MISVVANLLWCPIATKFGIGAAQIKHHPHCAMCVWDIPKVGEFTTDPSSCPKKRVWCSGWLCSQMANVKSGAEASYSLYTAVRYALQKVKKWPQSFLGQLWTSCEASSYMADNFAFCNQFDLNWQWQWEVGYSQQQQWLPPHVTSKLKRLHPLSHCERVWGWGWGWPYIRLFDTSVTQNTQTLT